MNEIGILENFFKNNKQKKYSLKEIEHFFGKEIESTKLNSLLKKLEEKGKVYYIDDKYMFFPEHSNFFIGTLKVNKKGIYYIVSNNKTIYINSSKLNGAINEDLVLVSLIDNGKDCGIIKNIITKGKRNEVFEVTNYEDNINLKCLGPCKDLKVYLDKNLLKNYANGDRLSIDLDYNDKNYTGKIKSYIGNKDDPDSDIMLIAAKKEVYLNFNKDSLKQLENIPVSVSEKDILGRVDLRKKITFTIDGATAKDFDDAISIEKLSNGNFLLGKHITDLPSIIPLGSPLFWEAIERGTSFYLGPYVFPQFPHKISNGIGSLNPHVDRLTKSIFMEYTPEGKLISTQILPFTIIHSSCRMTYDQVNNVFLNTNTDEKYYPFINQLNDLNKMSHFFSKDRIARGKISFADTEVEIIENKNNNLVANGTRTRGDSEIIIENMALNHNEVLGTYCYNNNIPFIYRNHDKPNSEKLEQICLKLQELGYKFNIKNSINNAYSLNSLLNKFKKYKEYEFISELLVQAMSRAYNSTNNIGHFGLGIKENYGEAYAQASSPIRRGSDLINQYLIDYYIGGKTDMNIDIILENLEEFANHFSKRERTADELERDIDNYLLAKIMESKIGENISGIVLYMGKDSIIVKAENGARGKINIKENKHYKFDYNNLILFVDNEPVKVGDEVVLRIKDVNKDERKIKFDIIEKIEENKSLVRTRN